jgi:hypothetical protein
MFGGLLACRLFERRVATDAHLTGEGAGRMNEHVSNDRAGTAGRGSARCRHARRRRRAGLRGTLAIVLGAVAVLAVAPIAGAQAAGSIQGVVREATGANGPVEGVEVEVLTVAGEKRVASALTDAAGEYKVEGLATGSYKADFVPPFGSPFIAQFFKAKSTFAAAEAIAVTDGTPTTGISAELVRGATISGTVQAEGAALQGAEVVVLPAGAGEPTFSGFAVSKAGGAYSIAGVPPGEYTVLFSPRFGENLVPQLWDDKDSFSGATPIVVTGEAELTNIGANLRVGGQISGTVTDAATHQPVANVFVLAENARGFEFLGGDAETDANGHFTIPGLATGSYSLELLAEGPTEYLPLTTGLIGVTQPGTTSGVGASLTRAAPVNTSAPVIAGTPTVGGSALSCSTGSWTGRATLKYTYQWTRDGSPIANATGSSYVAQAADQGHGLVCQVTATNAVGRATAASGTLAVASAPAPKQLFGVKGPPPSPPRVVATSVATVSAGVAKLRLSCRGRARCVGTLKLVREVIVRTHKKHRTLVSRRSSLLAQGAFSIASGRTAQVSMRLTSAGRGRLAHAHRHRLATTLVLTVKGGFATRQSVLLLKAATRRGR